jgi:6,7-dimethyl-8-ribityllumazine synthase
MNQMSNNELTSDTTSSVVPLQFARSHRVAFIQSSWHRDIVEACRLAFLDEISARGIPQTHVGLFEVPGAYANTVACAASG